MDINININNADRPLNTPWNFGVNTCHAILWTRNDLQRHAKTAHEELGFRYVRFHNVISKHLDIYRENDNGEPVLNFQKFDEVFDNVIKNGYLPFFEIGFCPELLSQHTRDLCYYEADPSIPVSFEKWDILIKGIISHCMVRYGAQCVRRWYFEVWNEPDLFYDGTKDDYFELYDHTVLAVKSVDSSLRVGGPATSKCLWVDEFIAHIEKGSELTEGKPVPCDFISTHAYPSDIAFLDADYGDVELQESATMKRLYSDVRSKMDASSLKDLPLIMGEWNSSAGPFAENHDEKNNAAFIVKIFGDLKDIIDGSLYWNLSDIYEEQGFHYIPFHGGYGLFNINDIKKSSYYAFEMLNRLKGREIISDYEGNGKVRALAAHDCENKVTRIILYYYREPGDTNCGTEIVCVNLTGFSSQTLRQSVYAVTDEGGSAYEWWQKIGSPQFVNDYILDYLKEKSMPVKHNEILFSGADCFSVHQSLVPGDCILIEIEQ